MEYEKLGTNREDKSTYQGEGLRNSQERGTEQGFDKVNKVWLSKCQTYEQGLQSLEEGKAETEDLRVCLDDVSAKVGQDGKFCMQVAGRDFVPTEHAVNQMGTSFGTGTWLPGELSRQEHIRDAEVLAVLFNHGRDKLALAIDASKRRQTEFIVRTRQDGSMRAFLTAAYRPIDNRWFLDKIAEFVPGGLLSHWKGDGDTIFGNVLIPDTIREEDDSDYGGMISVGNCEIGTRRNSLLPSIFRHICFNGNIWNQEAGKGVNKVHRGKIDLDDYAERMRVCIHEQIPLMTTGIQLLLDTKQLATDVNMRPVFAQFMLDNKVAKSNGNLLLAAYADEVQVTEATRGTLFGIVNAVTRAGQKLDNKGWVDFDLLGGSLITLGQVGWASLTGRAAKLDMKAVDELFVAV